MSSRRRSAGGALLAALCLLGHSVCDASLPKQQRQQQQQQQQQRRRRLTLELRGGSTSLTQKYRGGGYSDSVLRSSSGSSGGGGGGGGDGTSSTLTSLSGADTTLYTTPPPPAPVPQNPSTPVVRVQIDPAVRDALKVAVGNLFFSEHGRCGASNRKSQRCVEGYETAAITNALAGLTCSLAMIPEAVSFSFLAGVHPLVGLWTTVAMGGVASTFGGRGGLMTGASGACAMVMAGLVKKHGLAYLSPAVLLTGLFQVAAGKMRLGKYIRLVPHPVMLGFVNGLAIVIFRAQLAYFFGDSGALLGGAKMATMAGLTALTCALVKVVPMYMSERFPLFPTSLFSVFVVTILSKLFRLPATTLGDIAGADTFGGGLAVLPKIGIPGLSALKDAATAAAVKATPTTLWGTDPAATAAAAAKVGALQVWQQVPSFLAVILPYAATMAVVGLIESLLTLQLVDGVVDDGTQGSTSAECVGQGLANVASSLTGGMGGCALIGQSIINLDSGGVARLSGVVMSLSLGLGIVMFAPLLAAVPVASCVGLMLMVCHSTFSWSSLRLLGRIPNIDMAILVLVSLITVWKDLAVAVVAGTVLNSLSFAWKMSTLVTAQQSITEEVGGHNAVGGAAFKYAKVYTIEGNIFFGSARHFKSLFEDAASSPPLVFLDFANSRVWDHSGLEALSAVCKKFEVLGKKVVVRNLSRDCAVSFKALDADRKNRPPAHIVETSTRTNPTYAAAVDRPRVAT
jgi:SulP family sulfate permease